MGNYTSKGAAMLAMLTVSKDDDDDGEMKWYQKKFKKVVKSLSSIYMDCGYGY